MEFDNAFTEVDYNEHRVLLKSNGRYGKRLDLSNADLSNADLSNADLSKANLSNADLSKANLSNADLYRANLSNADLYRANLSNADLYRANLYRANLSNADLSKANLSNADLSKANLYRANLYYAKGIIQAVFCRDLLVYTYTDKIHIGCVSLTIKEWLNTFEEVGKDNDYTPMEINLYGNMIKMISDIYNKTKVDK